MISADQTAWVELAQAVRAQLMKSVQDMPRMDAAELAAFMDACRNALFFEQNASSFDRGLQKELAETLDEGEA